MNSFSRELKKENDELLAENALLKEKIRVLESKHEICPYCGQKTLRYVFEDENTYAVCSGVCGLRDFVGPGDIRHKYVWGGND